jgi:hypothetical protein
LGATSCVYMHTTGAHTEPPCTKLMLSKVYGDLRGHWKCIYFIIDESMW